MSEVRFDPHENPFCATRLRPGIIDYIFPAGGNVQQLIDVLIGNRWIGQIVGPHGSGKSTLLAGLIDALRIRGHVVHETVLHDRRRSLPAEFWMILLAPAPIERKTIVVIDGFEQLAAWNRWRLLRLVRKLGLGLVVTAHATAGFPALFRTEVDIARAWQVVERLQRGNAGGVCRDDLSHIWPRHNGNVRETLFELYDLYEMKRRQQYGAT